VDALTIAFGLRNVTRTLVALKDINRVLKRGGRFLCMEFSHLPEGIIKEAYDAYSFNVIPPMGEALAGDAQVHPQSSRCSHLRGVQALVKFIKLQTPLHPALLLSPLAVAVFLTGASIPAPAWARVYFRRCI
jgi:hypothetical protein